MFAIQGPPGAGKTFTGARMICELVKAGKKIGVTALSHKVIRQFAGRSGGGGEGDEIQRVCGACSERATRNATAEIAIAEDNDEALEALQAEEPTW